LFLNGVPFTTISTFPQPFRISSTTITAYKDFACFAIAIILFTKINKIRV